MYQLYLEIKLVNYIFIFFKKLQSICLSGGVHKNFKVCTQESAVMSIMLDNYLAEETAGYVFHRVPEIISFARSNSEGTECE